MKKTFLVVAAIFLMALVSNTFAQQVQSGDFKVDEKTSGYTLASNEGDRIYTMEVTFEKPFEIKPSVILSVNLVEAASGTTLRYHIASSAVSRDGFVIKIKTWGDSQIRQVGGSWIAVSGKE